MAFRNSRWTLELGPRANFKPQQKVHKDLEGQKQMFEEKPYEVFWKVRGDSAYLFLNIVWKCHYATGLGAKFYSWSSQ